MFPGVLRLRVTRHLVAGTALMLVATVCLVNTTAVSGQSNGTAQIILAAIAFVAFGSDFLSLFVGLLDASKDVIERYRSDH